jgi:hypothetical protein
MNGINVLHLSLNNHVLMTDFKPDVYIGIKANLGLNLISYFKRINCKTIQLNPDDPDIFERAKVWVDQYDYFFTNSETAQIMYAKEKMIVDVCSFAVDEKLVEECQPRDEFKCDIMFVGGSNMKKYRYEYLNALKGLDVKVYGKFPQPVYGKQDRYLSTYQDYFSALKSAKIGIDFSVSGAGFLNVKTKSFEIPACQSLMVVNQFDEMTKYYDYNKEIIGFRTPQELRKVCEYYLQNDGSIIGERLNIVNNAYKRFLKEHTWEKRIKEVFEKCGIET